MEQEAAPMIEEFQLAKQADICSISKCLLYSGEYHGCALHLVTNGKCPRYGVDEVGTAAASLNAYIAIKHVGPDLIINAGTAGGFGRKSAAIGDTFIVTDIKSHDRRIPIPAFAEYSKGNYSAHPTPNMVTELQFKVGVLTTANSLDHSATDDVLMLENDASVKDMEGSGVAWVAHLANVPLVCVKVVTDIVDGEFPTQDEFLQNLGAAALALKEALPRVVRYVAGKPAGAL